MLNKYCKSAIGVAAAVAAFYFVSPSSAIEEKMLTPCREAFLGKCFRGEVSYIDWTTITSELDADVFCDSNPNYCGPECGLRVKVIAGVYASGQRNPCLPW
jgi:hypothetical protein